MIFFSIFQFRLVLEDDGVSIFQFRLVLEDDGVPGEPTLTAMKKAEALVPEPPKTVLKEVVRDCPDDGKVVFT